MRSASQNSKLSILLDHVDQWRARLGSREAVAVCIVEKHIELGLNESPRMHFEQLGDPFTRAKVAADRIFRWLDDKTKDGTLMPANFEVSILAAMPSDLRISCINESLAPLGYVVQIADQDADPGLDAIEHLVAVGKETSEAVGAIAAVVSAPTAANLAQAEKELAEADEVIDKARAAIRKAVRRVFPRAVA